MSRLPFRFAAATRAAATRYCAVVCGCVAILSAAACATTVRRAEPPPVKREPPPVKVAAIPVNVEPPPVEAEPAQENRQSSVISFHGDAGGVDFTPWITGFVAHLKRNWLIPYSASSLRGHVAVAFRVQKDGRITDVVLERPSGIASFDEASSRTVAACNPTSPLPSEYVREYARFTVTFYYNELPPKREAGRHEPPGSASIELQPNTRMHPPAAGADGLDPIPWTLSER